LKEYTKFKVLIVVGKDLARFCMALGPEKPLKQEFWGLDPIRAGHA
jgi:hypothetical protein